MARKIAQKVSDFLMTPCIDYSFLLRNKSFVTCVLVFVVTKLSIVYSLPPYVAPPFYFVIFSSLFFLFSLPFVLLQLHQYVALLLTNSENLCPCSPPVPFFYSSSCSLICQIGSNRLVLQHCCKCGRFPLLLLE